MSSDLRKKVFEVLNAAQAAGADLKDESIELVACEIQDRDPDLEWCDLSDLYPHIIDWQMGDDS